MAAHEPEPPWWTPRKTATPRRALSREVIVAAALPILRAEGVDAVSMRRVATALGTGPASLYAHVANKDELLDLLYDELLAPIRFDPPDARRWREQVTGLWTDVRNALASGRDIALHGMGRVPMGPHSLRIAEQFMAVLRLRGVPDQAVGWAVDVVGTYVSGSAVEDALDAELARDGRDPDAYYDQVHRYFTSLPPERFPTIAALSGPMTAGGGEERFRFGLDLLIGGLVALADAPPSGAPGSAPVDAPVSAAPSPAGPSAARRATARRRSARSGASPRRG